MYKPWERFDVGTGYGRMTPRFMGIAELVIGGLAIGATAYTAVSASDTADQNRQAQTAATQSAQQQQMTAADKANQIQVDEFNQQQQNIKPWITAGTGALNQLSAGTAAGGQFSTVPQFNFDPSKITTDPGYDFRMKQGVNAISAAGSAAGNLGSGSMGTALVNYGQAAGSQEYQNAYSRAYQSQMDAYNSQLTGQNTLFNRLSGIAGTGQTANSQLASAGQNYANQSGSNLTNAATNIGNLGVQGAQLNAGYANQGQNSMMNAVGGISNQLMGGLQGYQYQNNLNNQNWNWGGSNGVTQGYDPYTNYSGGAGPGPYAAP